MPLENRRRIERPSKFWPGRESFMLAEVMKPLWWLTIPRRVLRRVLTDIEYEGYLAGLVSTLVLWPIDLLVLNQEQRQINSSVSVSPLVGGLSENPTPFSHKIRISSFRT
jgi:hypothetical protein